MVEATADHDDLLEGAKQIETWFWDGDFSHVLGCIEGEEDQWLVERGVLHTEDDDARSVSDLLEGDVVYRIRRIEALVQSDDSREELFTWSTVNPETGTVTPRVF